MKVVAHGSRSLLPTEKKLQPDRKIGVCTNICSETISKIHTQMEFSVTDGAQIIHLQLEKK